MPELTDAAKSTIRDYLDERQEVAEEKRHKQTIRLTAIAGVLVGGFFALVVGLVSFLFSNLEQSAITSAQDAAKVVLQSDKIAESIRKQQEEALEAGMSRSMLKS